MANTEIIKKAKTRLSEIKKMFNYANNPDKWTGKFSIVDGVKIPIIRPVWEEFNQLYELIQLYDKNKEISKIITKRENQDGFYNALKFVHKYNEKKMSEIIKFYSL